MSNKLDVIGDFVRRGQSAQAAADQALKTVIAESADKPSPSNPMRAALSDVARMDAKRNP